MFREIKRARRICLFLDYDGTLVPIRKDPRLAVLQASKRRLLERLSRNVVVCIVSGRSLFDIRKMVAIKNIAYIGNHGLEIIYQSRRWTHPDVKMIKPALKAVLDRVRGKTAGFPALLFEDKGLTGSIHYRGLTAALSQELTAIVKHEMGLKKRELKLTRGKKVFEIRPNVGWDKGKGIREFSRWLGPQNPDLRIYVGDDQTDEDAFKALGKKDMTILVGKKRDSSATARLSDVAAVWRFLDGLLSVMTSLPFKKHLGQGPK